MVETADARSHRGDPPVFPLVSPPLGVPLLVPQSRRARRDADRPNVASRRAVQPRRLVLLPPRSRQRTASTWS